MNTTITAAAMTALLLAGSTSSAAWAQDNPAPTTDEAATTGATVTEGSGGWTVKAPGSKLTPQELAAFRAREGLNADGTAPGPAKKDEAWLKTVRQRLGTGEFKGNGAKPLARKDGTTIVNSCPVSDPCSPGDPNAPTTGSGYAYLSYMVQRRQATSSACGKATVSEMAATVPGRSSANLAQSTVAAYLGETTADATNYREEGNALNHFVGVPNFGRNFYTFRWMGTSGSTLPTSAQRAQFRADLKGDIANYRTPLTAGVIEVANDIHLVGHDRWRRYEHWINIGGWNDNSTPRVWYADSFTGYGTAATVPPKSWLSRTTMENLIGGWGYYW